MENSKNKKDIFYFVVLILTLITMTIGITFTYFSMIAKEKDDGTRIQTGTLAINYIEGKTINTYALMPINEPTLNTKYSVYKKEFYVSSTGTLDQTLDLYINITKNEFSPNALKYALYNSLNRKIADGYIPVEAGEKILMRSGVYLKNNTTEKFTVLIWLQENNQNQDHEMGNTFIGGFDITATQLKLQ